MTDQTSLPSNLLVAAEVIRELRLDQGEYDSEEARRLSAMRRLKYLRDTRKISFLRVGHKMHLYPRAALERFKMQNTVEAAE